MGSAHRQRNGQPYKGDITIPIYILASQPEHIPFHFSVLPYDWDAAPSYVNVFFGFYVCSRKVRCQLGKYSFGMCSKHTSTCYRTFLSMRPSRIYRNRRELKKAARLQGGIVEGTTISSHYANSMSYHFPSCVLFPHYPAATITDNEISKCGYWMS